MRLSNINQFPALWTPAWCCIIQFNSDTLCCAKLLRSCLTLCDPVDCSPPGSSVHGILQARILEWVACPPPGNYPDPGTEPASLTLCADGDDVGDIGENASQLLNPYFSPGRVLNTAHPSARRALPGLCGGAAVAPRFHFTFASAYLSAYLLGGAGS